MRAKKNILSAAVAILVGAGGAQPVLAQGDEQLIADSERLIEELLVVGTAASDRNSTQLKRDSDLIMDALMADEVGALPDLNIAEVFERISGISTTSANADDEGQYILIRGTTSNSTYFDGMGMASPSSARRTSMESIPSGAVVRAEVNKSMSAKSDGQGLGGSVNMGTRSAFSSDEMFLKVDMEATQYSEDRAPISDVGISPKLGVTYADTFGADDQFGVVLALETMERSKEVIKHFQEYDWENDGADAYTSKKPWAEDRTGDYTRNSVLAKVEWQSDDVYAFLSGFYFDKDENNLSNRWILNRKGELNTHGDGHADSTKGYATVLDRNEAYQRYNARMHFHLDTVINDVHAVNFDIIHGRARRDRQDIKWQFGTDNNKTELGFETFGRGNWSIEDPEYFSNGENYDFDYYEQGYSDYVNEVTEAKTDWEMNIEDGENAWGLGAGAKFRRNAFSQDNTKYKFQQSDLVELTEADFDGGYGYQPDGFMGYVAPHSNRQVFLDYVAANPEHFETHRDYTKDDGGFRQLRENLQSDYVFDEDISSAYVMARYLTPVWSISGGVRVEHTAVSSSAWTKNNTDEIMTPSEIDFSYTNVLPSLNVIYNITDDWKVRAAASKSIRRQNPGDSNAKFEVWEYGYDKFHGDLGESYSVKEKRKSTTLDPQESVNTEISLEYYFSDNDFANGMVSVTAFNKDIINAPIDLKHIELNVAKYDGQSVYYEEKTADSDRLIRGYEFNLKMRNFGFLPQSLQGLGMTLNGTWLSGNEGYTDYKGDTVDYDDLQDQPDRMANAQLYYGFMDGRGEVKLAYKYKGYTRIGRDNSNPYKSQFWAPREQLDVEVKYQVMDGLKLKLQVKNLTEEATYRMQGFKHELLRHNNQYGRSLILGGSYQF